MLSCTFFFFKQKTAYEMRISDWSSDVCSSDLVADDARGLEHGVRVDRGQPAPGEGGLVHLDRGAVQLHRTHQRFERQRHQPLLPGVAEHEQVGGDRVAKQRGGHAGGVELQRRAAVERVADGGNDVRGRELQVRAGGERSEEHTSELQSLMRISYAVFCLKKKNKYI